MEDNKNFTYFVLGIIIISFAMATYFYPNMPEISASHWNTKGMADDFSSKFSATFTMPFMILALGILLFVIPLIALKNKNIVNFRKEYNSFVILFLLLFLYLYILTIYFNIVQSFNMGKMLFPALGILFIYLSFRLEKIPRNNIMGIRTPWSVIDDVNWGKTHKLGSALFKILGLMFILTMFYTEISIYPLIIYLVLMIIILFVYSFVITKKKKNS